MARRLYLAEGHRRQCHHPVGLFLTRDPPSAASLRSAPNSSQNNTPETLTVDFRLRPISTFWRMCLSFVCGGLLPQSAISKCALHAGGFISFVAAAIVTLYDGVTVSAELSWAFMRHARPAADLPLSPSFPRSRWPHSRYDGLRQSR